MRYIVFTSNNARVFEYVGTLPKGALLNPDLSQVGGVSPHYWKRGKGRCIVKMSIAERLARDADHALHGVDNEIGPQCMRTYQKVLLASATLAALGSLVLLLKGVIHG